MSEKTAWARKWLQGRVDAVLSYDEASAEELSMWRVFKEELTKEMDLQDTQKEGVSLLKPSEVYQLYEELQIAYNHDLDELQAKKDNLLLERNHLVACLAHMFPSGIRKTEIPGWNPQMQNCVYIDLPYDRQISYHYHDSHAELFADLPPYTKEWNGHNKLNTHNILAALPRDSRKLDVEWLLELLKRRSEEPMDAVFTEESLRGYDVNAELLQLLNDTARGIRTMVVQNIGLLVLRKAVAQREGRVGD